MQFRILIIGVIILFQSAVFAQTGITLEDIWKNYKFYEMSVPGFNFLNDGRHYTKLNQDRDQILKFDITTGSMIEEVWSATNFAGEAGFEGEISAYTFTGDESKIIIESQRESIYRRSSKAVFHIYDRTSKVLTPVYEEGKVQYCTVSPDGTKAAYVFMNDLYYLDLATGITEPITTDGSNNEIINGATDWVYEEEFGFAKAFFWSPDSKKIAYIRFDETAVPEFTMTEHHDGVYPEYITFKYPKVGQKNADVSTHIFDISKGKTVKVDIGDMSDKYIPRIKWTKDVDRLCVYKMNRHQNHLQLFLANSKSGQTTLLLEEKNEYYISITDNLTFLEDGKHFIWTSEKSGYNHIYLHDMIGKVKKTLTKGNYDVSSFYGTDEANSKVYYQAAKVSPLQREVYETDVQNGTTRKVTSKTGTNSAQYSSTYDYFVWKNSNINSPSEYGVYDRSGKLVRGLEDNTNLKSLHTNHQTQPLEFFDFTNETGDKLNGWMLKPANMESGKKYPVFMTVYGGPGSQTVTDSYKGMNYWWHQMLAANGYIVVSVDNRGTGGRGEEFKKMTYLQLGKYETEDQISAAKYLGTLPYVDASRIGIFGWSYGGYMSSLCILKGNDVFKSAIAVAPVTNWKWYDTIYTERYMRTEEENADGYKDNSPVYFADQLKGSYLLVHGDADDNVHVQNSVEMASALIKANKQFDTYFYPNRNHGIYGDNARLHLYTKMTNFILETL